jgi:hypothetical protein
LKKEKQNGAGTNCDGSITQQTKKKKSRMKSVAGAVRKKKQILKGLMMMFKL